MKIIQNKIFFSEYIALSSISKMMGLLVKRSWDQSFALNDMLLFKCKLSHIFSSFLQEVSATYENWKSSSHVKIYGWVNDRSSVPTKTFIFRQFSNKVWEFSNDLTWIESHLKQMASYTSMMKNCLRKLQFFWHD